MTSAGTEKPKTAKARPVTVKLLPVPNAPGTYRNQHVPSSTGFYRLTLVGADAEDSAATTVIEVASQFEFDHPAANRARLAELVSPSVGGGVVELGEIAGLPGRIQSKKKQTIEPGEEFSLWANPLCLGLLAALLGLEWAIRKRSNLA
jgi:hypothetical protein